MKRKCFFYIFLVLFSFQVINAQESNKKSIYLGFEPFSFALGTKGLFLDYRAKDKFIYNFYAGYHSWWTNNDEIRENGKYPLSDYYLASFGPVFRTSFGFVFSKNDFQFSEVIVRPELTYKYLTYNTKCFYNGSNGLSSTPRQLRSFKSNYLALNIVFGFVHFDDSFKQMSFEWFIGSGLAMAFEEKISPENTSGNNCIKEIPNERTHETVFYPSIRFGVQIGFNVFISKE
jgi:hypothetical protein